MGFADKMIDPQGNKSGKKKKKKKTRFEFWVPDQVSGSSRWVVMVENVREKSRN